MTQTISLDRFHELFMEAYAVDVNGSIYMTSHDNSSGVMEYFIYDERNGYTEFNEVDGDIEVHNDLELFFYIAGDPIRLKFLTPMSIEKGVEVEPEAVF
jgi:hypothetical protein